MPIRQTKRIHPYPAPRSIANPEGPVVYWMQAAQRAQSNHALALAIYEANVRGVAVRVVFAMAPAFEGAGLRQFWFMTEGLAQTQVDLASQGLAMDCLLGSPDEVLAPWITALKPSLVVFDRGYLGLQRRWRAIVNEQLGRAGIPVLEVETEVVVPVETAYHKQAWSAAALRPHLRRLVPSWLDPVREQKPKLRSVPLPQSFCPAIQRFDPQSLSTPQDLAMLNPGLDTEVFAVDSFLGGRSHGLARLEAFADGQLRGYGSRRGDPSQDGASQLSPWLHFGQISVLDIIHTVLPDEGPLSLEAIQSGRSKLFEKAVPEQDIQAFLEELIVRRELATNYCWYNPHNESYQGLPPWAQASLEAHQNDPRPWTYTRQELEQAQTHDRWWNACQMQMVKSGHMHNYMRMYWGKKIIEWTADPEEAFATALWLNNRWELDGRDPNGNAGVAWCFGLHDRPWAERAVFGSIRYMNDKGLERKFAMEAYAQRWL